MFFLKRLFFKFTQFAYSQEGEDLILARLLEGQPSGFYVDIGAHHPKRFSNTYYSYNKGWRGINVDATPGSMKPFKKLRPRDINIESPVGTAEGELEYYQFNEPALNTFDKKLAEERVALGAGYQIIAKRRLPIRTLKAILDEHLPSNTEIDFLTVDVEGWDLDVLKSNDWEKYRPIYVLVEVLNNDMRTLSDDPCVQFLFDKGYELCAKAVNTVIMRRV